MAYPLTFMTMKLVHSNLTDSYNACAKSTFSGTPFSTTKPLENVSIASDNETYKSKIDFASPFLVWGTAIQSWLTFESYASSVKCLVFGGRKAHQIPVASSNVAGIITADTYTKIENANIEIYDIPVHLLTSYIVVKTDAEPSSRTLLTTPVLFRFTLVRGMFSVTAICDVSITEIYSAMPTIIDIDVDQTSIANFPDWVFVQLTRHMRNQLGETNMVEMFTYRHIGMSGTAMATYDVSLNTENVPFRFQCSMIPLNIRLQISNLSLLRSGRYIAHMSRPKFFPP